MTDLQTIKTDELEMNDAPALMWISVQEAVKLLWSENPKLHNIGDVVNSIVKYGFQELPKYDSNLPNVSGGTGAIKAGNGRIESLAWMENDGEYEMPRGLAKVKESGIWAMPLLIGTDAESLDMARAYAIDSNNLTMSGGDLTGVEQSFVWDGSYVEMLTSLQEAGALPISVDHDLMEVLSKYYRHSLQPEDVLDDIGELEEEDFWPILRIQIAPETYRLYIELMKIQEGENEAEKFQNLLDRNVEQ